MEVNMFPTVEVNIQTLCHGCLSGDRNLFPLGKYSDVYYTLFSNSTMDSQDINFCWECAATLKRIKQFQAKVEHAHMLLISQYADEQTTLPSLSSLTIAILEPKHTKKTDIDEITDDKTRIELTAPELTKTVFEHEAKNGATSLDNVQIKEEQIDDYDDFNVDSNDFDDVKSEENFDDYDDFNVDSNGFDDVKSKENLKIKNADVPLKEKKKQDCRSKKIVVPGVKKNMEYTINDKVRRNKLIKKMCKITYVEFDKVKDLLEREKKNELYKFRYKCKSCFLSFSNADGLQNHDSKFHDVSRKFVCDYCKRSFKTKAGLKRHVLGHREVLECVRCGLVVPGRFKMALHMDEVHRVSCNVCGATYRTVRMFFKHYNDLHVSFVCDICGKLRRFKHLLERHIKNAHTEHRCDICDIKFTRHASLLDHRQRKHVTTGGEEAYCVECDRQFPNAKTYRRHQLSHVAHKRDKEAYRNKLKCACPECGKVYANRCGMRNHYNYVHLKQSKYVCKICDRQFLNRTRYVAHMRVNHEGKQAEKNKICQYCGKGFHTNRILINHTRTHTGERPHACAHCPAAFAQQHALRAHVAHVHLRVKRNKRA